MIEIPPERRKLPKKTESTATLHPEVKKLLRSLQDVLGSTYSYRYTEKSDTELFAEALKARENSLYCSREIDEEMVRIISAEL